MPNASLLEERINRSCLILSITRGAIFFFHLQNFFFSSLAPLGAKGSPPFLVIDPLPTEDAPPTWFTLVFSSCWAAWRLYLGQIRSFSALWRNAMSSKGCLGRFNGRSPRWLGRGGVCAAVGTLSELSKALQTHVLACCCTGERLGAALQRGNLHSYCAVVVILWLTLVCLRGCDL